jgi:hypothetical protein
MPQSDTKTKVKANGEEELQVTTPEQWKGGAREGTVTSLPSGNNVRVKRTMDLIEMLKAGRLPNPLSVIVQKMVDGKQDEVKPEELAPEDVILFLKMIDDTVLRCVTEPIVQRPPDPEPNEEPEAYEKRINAWAPDDGCLPLSYFTLEDRMFIFVYAQGFAADLASFREKTGEALARVADGKPVPRPTKRTGGSGKKR